MAPKACETVLTIVSTMDRTIPNLLQPAQVELRNYWMRYFKCITNKITKKRYADAYLKNLQVSLVINQLVDTIILK